MMSAIRIANTSKPSGPPNVQAKLSTNSGSTQNSSVNSPSTHRIIGTYPSGAVSCTGCANKNPQVGANYLGTDISLMSETHTP